MRSRHLELGSLINTRDLGGMKTADGRTILPGKLIRSGQLFGVSPSDLERISELVDTVVDFRTEREKAECPDVPVPGSSYHFIPVLESFAKGISREKKSDEDFIITLARDPEEACRHMCAMYSAFVESDYSLSRYGRFLRILLEDHDRAVLWHCSVGKDRAGIGALLVQKILGVSDEDVIEDYLATNDYVQDEFRKVSALVHQKLMSDDPSIDRSMEFFFFANRSYIESFFDSINKRFGSFNSFVRDGLGLSDEDVTLLRQKYLSRS